MNRFSPIDPKALPMISLVEIPDKEALVLQRMKEVKARWTFYDPPLGAVYDVENLEFDPIKITMEAGASAELNALSLINSMGKATTLAFAAGQDLDALASRYPGGVPRLPGEDDERYRYRIWLSPNSFSTAGSAAAYVFQAMTAAPGLRDATAIAKRDSFDREPEIVVTCLQEGDDPIPAADELLSIRQRLIDKNIGTLTDIVVVQAPTVIAVDYKIRVWFLPAVDRDAARARIDEALAALISQQRYLGAPHTIMAIYAAVRQYGVVNAVVDSPTRDIVPDETQIVVVGQVEVLTEEGAFQINKIVVAGIMAAEEGADIARAVPTVVAGGSLFVRRAKLRRVLRDMTFLDVVSLYVTNRYNFDDDVALEWTDGDIYPQNGIVYAMVQAALIEHLGSFDDAQMQSLWGAAYALA